MTSIGRRLLLTIAITVSMSAIAEQTSMAAQMSDDSMTLFSADTNLLSNTMPLATKKPAPQIDWTIMATAHSPAQPITTFIKDWDAPLDEGEHAYVQARTAINVKPANSRISYGLAWRYDYLMRFNQQTADLYWQYQNKQIPNQNQTYELQLEAKHNERFGANVGFTQQLSPNWQLTTQANIWQGLHVLEGAATGSLTSQAFANGEVVRNIDRIDNTLTQVDYYYDKPALGEEDLNWYPDKPKGYGYSLDLNLLGRLSDNTQLAIRGYDILGRMHWQDTPSTTYLLDYDINRATIDKTRGQLNTADVTQTLPWRVEANLLHQFNNQWQLGAQAQANDLQTLYQLSVGYQISNARFPVKLTGLLEPQTKALGLAIDNKYGGLKFLADSLDAEKAKRSEISLYGRYSW